MRPEESHESFSFILFSNFALLCLFLIIHDHSPDDVLELPMEKDIEVRNLKFCAKLRWRNQFFKQPFFVIRYKLVEWKWNIVNSSSLWFIHSLNIAGNAFKYLTLIQGSVQCRQAWIYDLEHMTISCFLFPSVSSHTQQHISTLKGLALVDCTFTLSLTFLDD
jgi:hypothetical protein